ncbi:nucleotidyl transferase family protein [Effusibacillus dendaii]|uniref:hypothetical protein n=1 Tax=Effusibacillus dendaii TaxID=2743772 RepID=UPI0021F59034|nr:hypothetical protein [Effusibacillus dendaii]
MGNAIELDSSPEDIAFKIRLAVTDPARIHKNDPGHPNICPIYAYHRTFRSEGSEEIREGCEKGTIGCAGCKQLVTAAIQQLLELMQERRSYYEVRPKKVDDILMSGTVRARVLARETMVEVREAMGLNYFNR